MGVSDIVHLVEHDVTAASLFSVLPKQGTVDVVTMSYSMSMIPDQKAAVSNAARLLKPHGHLAVADLFLEGRHDALLPPIARFLRKAESYVHKAWFYMDNVHLLGKQQLQMGQPDLVPVFDVRFRGAMPYMPLFSPYHGVYIMQKQP